MTCCRMEGFGSEPGEAKLVLPTGHGNKELLLKFISSAWPLQKVLCCFNIAGDFAQLCI